MKIVFTGDIHNHPGFITRNTLESFAESIFAENPDLIILGGDIGENNIGIGLFEEVLKIFKHGALVLGNHDLWVKPSQPHSSKDLWDTILPKICKDMGWHYLENENWIQDGVAVVGSYLHYDYSAADPGGVVVDAINSTFPDWTPDEYYKRMKKRYNNDAQYITGLPEDKEFAKQIGNNFQQRLLDAENNPEIHTIIVATHVPCMPSQITRRPLYFQWSASTPYFGHLGHVDVIKSCSKVKKVISCHSHQANRATEEFDDGHKVEIINLGADYGNPEFELITI